MTFPFPFFPPLTPSAPGWVPVGAIASWELAADRSWRQWVGEANGVAGLSVSRASSGWDTPGGILTAYAANMPRRSSLGLRIETARTNGIRNSAASGAVAGTPGTPPSFGWAAGSLSPHPSLAWSIAGVGTTNGFTYIDARISGTSGTTGSFSYVFDTTLGVPYTAGDTVIWSAYIALVGGSLANLTTVRPFVSGRNSSGTQLGSLTAPAFTPTATLTRYVSNAYTPPVGTAYTQPGFNLVPVAAAAIDATFRIALPQIETGTTPSTPIVTTGAAGLRNADTAVLDIPNGTYTIIVRDGAGSETRTGVVVSGGAGYTLTPRAGQTLVTHVEVYL